MKKRNLLLTTVLGLGLIVGSFAFMAKNDASKPVEVKATEVVPNADFYSVYASDAYNNGNYNDNFNQTLFIYDGPKTNDVNAMAISGNESVFDKILLNGQRLTTYAGSSISPWKSDQLWIVFIYPKTAVASGEGCTFEILQGFTLGSAVYSASKFILNSNLKWEKNTVVDNDPDVMNSDYKIFTLSDYHIASNSSFNMYTTSANVDAMSGSFCFQYNMNIADNTHNLRLYFSPSDIYGSNPLFNIKVNFNSNTYLAMSCTGQSYESETSANFTYQVGYDYLIRVYVFRNSSSTCTVLYGIDDTILWKTHNKDISTAQFYNHLTAVGTANTGSYYSSITTTTNTAINRFGRRYLDSETVAFDDNSETEACKSTYGPAKSFYNAYLTTAQKAAFANDASYANLKNRFVAWGAANGEHVTFDANGSISTAIVYPIMADTVSQQATIIGVVFAVLTTAMCFSYIAFKKKKHN